MAVFYRIAIQSSIYGCRSMSMFPQHYGDPLKKKDMEDLNKSELTKFYHIPIKAALNNHSDTVFSDEIKLKMINYIIDFDCSISLERKQELINDLKLCTKNGLEVALEDLALTFTYLPSSSIYGYTQAELLPNGSSINVTINNLEAYCELLLNFILQDGIAKQMKAFSDGFNEVFPLKKLTAFSAAEARLMICGEQYPHWNREDIISYTEPKLGYSKDSPGFLRFVNVLLGMSGNERKAFLQFTTGCSSLPPGGLSNLHPRLTVVRKVDAGVGSYPSVNTCVHYLKLPDYPTEKIMKERLLTATKEKGFHLN
ncbi:E3 ubiquitin-protein ligase Ufd4-like [Drosophila miranda]|uniref:E3 ubiquitin-protein ligase Ufd4-like n=1 Tax=Drosophila miranda TaxID=7229 RepID=UPI00143F2A8C|nr:E3 ubiquitin-protein ligase Ufd4-like [Drosophila miranda]